MDRLYDEFTQCKFPDTLVMCKHTIFWLGEPLVQFTSKNGLKRGVSWVIGNVAYQRLILLKFCFAKVIKVGQLGGQIIVMKI